MRTLLALAVLALLAPQTRADEVTFPLRVEYPILRVALRQQLDWDPSGTAVVWKSQGGCRSLVVTDLQIEPAGDRVRLVARGAARLGFGVLGFCVAPARWDGFLEMVARPVVEADWQLRLRDLSSRLLDARGRPATVADRIWRFAEGHLEEEFADFAFDLGPPIEEARGLLRVSVEAERAQRVLAALDTLQSKGVAAEGDGLRVDVAMEVPAPARRRMVPEAALDPLELERWRAVLERWDGFLVFVVKDLGWLDRDPEVRDQLLELLLSSRQELLAALGTGPDATGDRVRRLFVDAWERIRRIVRRATSHGVPEDRILRYMTFLAAGDALAALDAAAPGLGLDVSADGLRRLVRIIRPDYVGDPLAYSDLPDPALRELFEFHDPLPSLNVEPRAWWPFGPRTAYAARMREELRNVAARLDRWVPEPHELEEYRERVARLLEVVAGETVEVNAIEPRFTRLFDSLVRATAWQESCWRQFVRRGGEVTVLRSATGDVGIMQVNRRVWRGFFDVRLLESDAAYNAGAGAEILAQLLKRYGSREAKERLENAARATYSAYNGGPDAYRRYRQTRISRRLRAIDQAFWEKFQAIASGKALDYVLCVEAWPGSRRAQLGRVGPGSTPKWSMRARSSRATSTIASRH
jgi:hypothetical protein